MATGKPPETMINIKTYEKSLIKPKKIKKIAFSFFDQNFYQKTAMNPLENNKLLSI